MLVRNPVVAERERQLANVPLRSFVKSSRGQAMRGEQHSKAVCELMASRRYGKYLKLSSDGIPRIDQAKVKQEARLDVCLVKTSDDTLSAEDVALGISSFLKSGMRSGPSSLRWSFVRSTTGWPTGSGLILICWMALLLVRVAETRVGDTWRKIRAQLERIRIVEIETPDGRVVQRTEISPAQRGILTSLDIPEPKRIHEIALKTKPGA